ncbi:hypothetical protein EJB05_22893, partial [Eragrostis curvula]
MAHDCAATPLLPKAGSKPRRRNMYSFFCATLASTTTVLMGYNLAVMSGAQLFISEDLGLSESQTEVLAGSINAYMLVSILAAGWAADALGRRGTLLVANAFFTAGALAMSLGGSYAALMAARFVTSVGSGFSVVVTSVYNAEISPASTRGLLSSMPEMFISVGLLLGYVSNYTFAGMPVNQRWRVMFGAAALPPALLACAALAVPESPRWLAMRGRHDDARVVLARTSDDPAEAELRLQEIKQAVENSNSNNNNNNNNSSSSSSSVWTDLLVRPSASVRRILTCVAGVHFFQQASGIDALVLYSPLVFKRAGLSSTSTALVATVAIGVVKMCFVPAAALFADRLGRRAAPPRSMAGVALSTLSLGTTLLCAAGSASSSPLTAAAGVASVLGFVAAFSVGLGPLANAYSAEVIPCACVRRAPASASR